MIPTSTAFNWQPSIKSSLCFPPPHALVREKAEALYRRRRTCRRELEDKDSARSRSSWLRRQVMGQAVKIEAATLDHLYGSFSYPIRSATKIVCVQRFACG